jgi:hypothetical protein
MTVDREDAAARAVWGLWDELDRDAQEDARDSAINVLHAADAVMFSKEAIERLYRELSLHHPTRGMAVTMGTTCECGYWTGREQPGVDRPVGVRGDQLDWHRTQVAIAVLKGEA